MGAQIMHRRTDRPTPYPQGSADTRWRAAQPLTTTTTTPTATATATATSTSSTSSGAAVRQAPATHGGPFENETSPPPAGYHIVDGTPIRPGVVMLQTQADPLTSAQLAQASQMYAAGC